MRKKLGQQSSGGKTEFGIVVEGRELDILSRQGGILLGAGLYIKTTKTLAIKRRAQLRPVPIYSLVAGFHQRCRRAIQGFVNIPRGPPLSRSQRSCCQSV